MGTEPPSIATLVLPGLDGRIGIAPCPSGVRLDEDIDRLAAWGATLVATLIETAEMRRLGVERIAEVCEARGIDWIHLPIADFSVPDGAWHARWPLVARDMGDRLRRGQAILVHCRAGLGRSGMVAAMLAVELGLDPSCAIASVRAVRPGAIETAGQEALVRGWPRTDEPARAPPWPHREPPGIAPSGGA